MAENKPNYLNAAVQNFLAIIGGYLLTFHLEQFIQLLVGIASGLKASYSLFGASFFATRSEWIDCDCVVITYITGPLLLLIAGVILYQRLKGKLEEGKTISRFTFWVIIFSFVRFFGGFLAGWLTHKGLWYALSWAYLPSTVQLVGSSVMFVAFLILCFFIRVPVLVNEGLAIPVLESNRYFPFVSIQLVLPYLMAASVLYLSYIRLLGWYEVFLLVMSGFVLVPILFGGKSMRLQQYLFPDESFRN